MPNPNTINCSAWSSSIYLPLKYSPVLVDFCFLFIIIIIIIIIIIPNDFRPVFVS